MRRWDTLRTFLCHPLLAGCCLSLMVVLALQKDVSFEQDDIDRALGLPDKLPRPRVRPLPSTSGEYRELGISLAPDRLRVRGGELIEIAETLSNREKFPIPRANVEPLSHFLFEVMKDGSPVPLTVFGDYLIRYLWTSMGQIHMMEPNQSEEFKIPINLLFDMTRSGQYQVRAIRLGRSWGSEEPRMAISNAIIVEVTDE